MPPRRVLMVLFHFPPIGGVPVPRNVRNVQYLPRFGWTPLVVAPRRTGGLMDQDGLALVPPQTRVIRSRLIEADSLRPFVRLARGVAGLVRRTGSVSSDPPASEGRRVANASGAGLEPSSLLRVQRLLFFPDNQVGWLPFALAAALRFRLTGGYDVVYSTSAPFTAHLVAGLVKQLTGARWVAEFRDPWVGNPVTDASAGPLPWFHRRLRTKVERWIVRSADRIVFVSPSTARRYRLRYPEAAPMVVITNGHDRSEIVARPPATAGGGRFRIVWTGTLDRPTELDAFLAGVAAFVARRTAATPEIEIVFYGSVSEPCRAIADQFGRERGLGSILVFKGLVPRRRALEALAEADAALVMLGAGPGMGQFVPGKLFEYLGQSTQVFAVLPPGDAREILHELDWGVVADPDASSVAHGLERLVTTPRPDRLADPEGRYDRVRLAGRLADVLCDAIDGQDGMPSSRPGLARPIDAS